MDRFMEYLAQSIPTNPEHAHVYGIFVSSYDEAVKAKERLEAGESFSKLVAELSIDPSKENGGDLGWFPKGVSVLHQDPFELKVGQIGDALAYAESTTEAPSVYYVITVTEFASRELDAKFLPELKSKTLQDWLTAENKEHTVKFTYNSEIDAWVNWQLSKAKSSTDSGS
jgi:hypothetical protein